MPSYCNYQYLFCGSYRKSALYLQVPSFLTSSMFLKAYFEHSGDIGISKTNLVIVELLVETIL
jgi:hypothetical protein